MLRAEYGPTGCSPLSLLRAKGTWPIASPCSSKGPSPPTPSQNPAHAGGPWHGLQSIHLTVALGSEPAAMGVQLLQTGLLGLEAGGGDSGGESVSRLPGASGRCCGSSVGLTPLTPVQEVRVGARQGWGEMEDSGPTTHLSCANAFLSELCQTTPL